MTSSSPSATRSISDDDVFDGAAVRNVEASLRDNDTPGVYVTEITPGSYDPGVGADEDGGSLVIEGDEFTADDLTYYEYTGRTDELLVQLQRQPDPGVVVRVKMYVDADGQQELQLSSADPRFTQYSCLDGMACWSSPDDYFTYYLLEFDHTDWDVPVLVTLTARDDPDNEDPFNAIIFFERDDDTSDLDGAATVDPGHTYVFPNIRSGTGATPVLVLDDETADVVSIESGTDTVVQKCGNDPCTVPGQSDDYTVRLTKRPTDLDGGGSGSVEVAILLDGLSDVVWIDRNGNGTLDAGEAITEADYQVVGGLQRALRFVGNLQVAGTTITRVNGSDLGDFLAEGFQGFALIEIMLPGGATYRATIDETGATEKVLTVTWQSTPAPDGTYEAATISSLYESGYFEGGTTVEGPEYEDVAEVWEGWTIVRGDGGSFLGDGFLEGQWIEMCESDGDGNCLGGGFTGRFKIQVIRGDNDTFDNKIELRYVADDTNPGLNPLTDFDFADSLAALADTDLLIRRIAAVATFTDQDWFIEQRIEIEADVWFRVPIARQGVKIYPVTTHGLYKLLGPLAIEGGVTGADRSLQLGLKLPGEADGPLFKIGNQPPESKQIDVVNIFNDGSKENRTGTLTSTQLTGLGLPGDLDFGPNFSTGNLQTFGEPVIFPGGIGFGTMQFVDGTYDVNGAVSTIEVINLMLGIGNDHLDIQGTIDPDVPVKLTGTVVFTDRTAGTLDGSDPGGVDLTRPEPFDWKAQGFLVGQPVQLSGWDGHEWEVLGFSDDDPTDTVDNTVMHLVLVTGPTTPTASQLASGSLVVFRTVTTTGGLVLTGDELVRTDGGNWLVDAVTPGKSVSIDGVGPFMVTGVFDLLDEMGLAGSDGVFETITLAGLTIGDGTYDVLEVVVTLVTASDVPVIAEGVEISIDIVVGGTEDRYGGYVTRHDGVSWYDDGFQLGQQVRIQGLDGAWRLQDVLDGPEGAETVLWLTRGNAALPAIDPATPITTDVYWPGPHGGLTVVHGGGNSFVTTTFELLTEDTGTDGVGNRTATLTRIDGGSWIDNGYSVGDRVAVDATGQLTWTITGFANADCPVDDPFPGCGVASIMLVTQFRDGDTAQIDPMPNETDPDALDLPEVTVHVARAGVVTVTESLNAFVNPAATAADMPTTSLRCAPGTGDCFDVTGSGGTVFEVGMVVRISGIAGGFTVIEVGGDFLTVQGAALQSTYSHIDVTDPAADSAGRVFVPILLTVTGTDADHDGGTAIGGDHIVVCNQALNGGERADDDCTADTTIAGPDSPLVVYGDTSQDGVWYSGEPFSVRGHEFGPKPYDPFWRIPESENEDDEWLFPVANPFWFHGDDVIDASGLYGWIDCSVACDLPSVGFTASGGRGDDLLIGSQTGDFLAGGSGDDTILGLRGVDQIYGDSGVNVDILTRGLSIETTNRSPAPTLDPRPLPILPENPTPEQQAAYDGLNNPVKPGNFTLRPVASPTLDLMTAGGDTIHGEGGLTYTVGDTVYDAHSLLDGDQVHYDDVIFGDHGEVIQQVADTNEPDTRLQKIQTTLLASIRAIESRAFQNGGDDTIFGGLGRDVIVGGAGHDMADGDDHDDLVFGDQIFLYRRVLGEAPMPDETNWTGPVDTTSGRFQTLCGVTMYSRTDLASTGLLGDCAGTFGADNSGKLLVDGTWRNYRDPDSPGIDDHPWWAEYGIFFDDDVTDADYFHNFLTDDETHGLGAWGNDYLAGGADHDMLFGQMGDDIIQGDGGIELAVAADHHVGSSRTPDGCPSDDSGTTAAGACDVVGDLDLIASFDSPNTDGQDYIEGNAGFDQVFGGLGQDDILGGSSDYFSLVDSFQRPDEEDRLFGGSGIWTGRNDNGELDPGDLVPGERHASDADVIVGDNGQIIRIVGAEHVDCMAGPHFLCSDSGLYVSYDYDDEYGAAGELVVRGVELLDYTIGGPDFRPDRFGLADPEGQPEGFCSAAGAEVTQDCSYVLPIFDGRNSYFDLASDGHREIFGNDEVHGGLSDDIVYVGGGEDVVYGDADDDDIILGWGSDWASGGVGSDGILGDDGRFFTSRNSDQGVNVAGGACTGSGNGTCWSEILNGITAFQPQGSCSENKSVLCGDFLDQYIATPGQVQNQVINIDGDLKKTVDITPFNLTPSASGGDQQLFDANNSDDVIFGGLGGEILSNYPLEIGSRSNEDPPYGEQRGVQGDFLHGGSGDDAIAGGESVLNAYSQLYAGGVLADVDGDGTTDAVRTDWTRPFNPGDLLHFGADTDAWHDQGPIVDRLGEFALYDEYDPRRTIQLDADGTVNKDGDGLTWFLTLLWTEGPILDGCIEYLPNGTCVEFAFRHSDGGDRIFGDLGNDWAVGGTGQDHMYGGWGNDLLNADDVMTATPGGGYTEQDKKLDPSPNDTPDTHPLYQDIAYGGAGLDILIGNTGGDRLIDWVGEFNSYIVPFAPFGIATVSAPGPAVAVRVPVRAVRQRRRRPDPCDRRRRRPGPRWGAVRRTGPGDPEGPRPVAGPDRWAVRSAAGQHPGWSS